MIFYSGVRWDEKPLTLTKLRNAGCKISFNDFCAITSNIEGFASDVKEKWTAPSAIVDLVMKRWARR